MAGRFGSKFKKRTSHTTSNIKTQSSPTVSKPPPPRRVSKPSPVKTSSSKINKLSLNIGVNKAWGAGANTATSATKDFTKPSTKDNSIPVVGETPPFDDPTPMGRDWFSDFLNDGLGYTPVSASGVLTEEKDLIPLSPLATYTEENPFTDGEDLPHATKNTITDAVIPAHFDKDKNKVEEKTVPYSDFAPGYRGGEVVGKDGAEIGIIRDYVTGEQRKSYYHPGSVSAEDHQAALDQQAIWQFENSIQSNYFKNITAGNMNDDMFKGLHDKIESSKVPKWKKEELWGEYADKNTNYKSRSTYGGYEGFGSNTTHKTGKVDGVQASNWDFGNTTSWKPNKAEKIKAKIDKDPLSVSQEDMAKFSVSTGQNIKPGGFDEFYNGTGTGFMDLTKINDKGNKKNKPIWFDYQDLGY